MNEEKLLRQAKALLATYRSDPSSPTGQTAFKILSRRLEQLGMKLEELEDRRLQILGPRAMHWERALAELVSCRHDGVRSSSEDGHLEGPWSEVGKAREDYDRLRRAVLLASGNFQRENKMWMDISVIPGALETFCNFVVMEIALRLGDVDSEEEMPFLDGILSSPGQASISVSAPSGHRGRGRGVAMGAKEINVFASANREAKKISLP